MTISVADVRDAHDAAKKAQADMRTAAATRNRLVRQALDAGIGAVELGKALDVDRQRIYTMAKSSK